MTTTCANYDAGYCIDHDYDHVLERQERGAAGSYAARRQLAAAYEQRDLLDGAYTVPPAQEWVVRDTADTVTADASDMGLRAAAGWPPVIVLRGTLYHQAAVVRDREGELQSVDYRTRGGRTLRLWND